jgi:uncharacterized protein YdcH (DUF465 family)
VEFQTVAESPRDLLSVGRDRNQYESRHVSRASYLKPLFYKKESHKNRGAEMGTKEEELIERVMREDGEFLRVRQIHIQLAKQLEDLEKKPYVTPQDEMEIKILKKKKLAAKDQMEKILMKYR